MARPKRSQAAAKTRKYKRRELFADEVRAARRRVEGDKHPLARLEWLLDFIQTDDVDTRERALEVQVFGDPNKSVHEYDSEDPPLRALKLMAEEILAGVKELRAGRQWKMSVPALTLVTSKDGARYFLATNAYETPGAQRAAAYNLIVGQQDRISVCSYRKCRRLFVARHRRSEYCSSEHSIWERQLRWRAAHFESDEDFKRKRSEQYQKATVARRKRRAKMIKDVDLQPRRARR